MILNKPGFPSIDTDKNIKEVDFGVTESDFVINNEPRISCRYVNCSDFNNLYKDIDGISLFHLDINSLTKHIDSTLLKQLGDRFKIIAITETRISSESIPHNLDLPNYSCIMTKTEEAAAGGTAIYIHNSVTFKVRNDLNMNKAKFLESSFAEIIQTKKENIIIGCNNKHPNLFKREYAGFLIS